MALVLLVVATVLTTLISTVAGAVALKVLRIGVPRVDLGAWGPRAHFVVAGSDISMSPWLLSGSSTFKDVSNSDVYGGRPGKLFSSFSRVSRALLTLVGPAAVLALAYALAGDGVFAAVGSAFAQILSGALHPLTQAQAYLSAFEEMARWSPLTAAGVLLAKFAAFFLLPVAPLNGGQALVELSRPRGMGYSPAVVVVQKVGLLMVLGLALAWLVAVGYWLFSGSTLQ